MRDPVLKINDDRKVKIQMGAIKDVGTMILLTVREYDVSNKQPYKEGDLERAWFRLSNDETN
jgi:transcriptional regulator of NAD metabolism